jgi:hypothetical protein
VRKFLPAIIAVAAAIAAAFLALSIVTPTDGFAAPAPAQQPRPAWLVAELRDARVRLQEAWADAGKAEIRIRQAEGLRERARAKGDPDTERLAAKVLEDARENERRARNRVKRNEEEIRLLESLKIADGTACESLARKMAHFEGGIRQLDDVIGKNDRFIREAVEERGKSETEIAKTTGKAVAELAAFRLQNIAKARDGLLNTKKFLDRVKTAMGQGKFAGDLTKGQIEHWKAWVDGGLKYSQTLADLLMMGDQYVKAPLPEDGVGRDSPSGDRFMSALRDFNDKFMYEAGGWEFVGEHLSEAVGGPALEAAFKLAVMTSSYATAAGHIENREEELRIFRDNREKMLIERARRVRRIKELEASLVDNRCLPAGYSD